MEKLNSSGGNLRDGGVPSQHCKQGVEILRTNLGVDTAAADLVSQANNQIINQTIGIIGANEATTSRRSSKSDIDHIEHSMKKRSHSLAQNIDFVNKNHEIAWRCAAAGIPIETHDRRAPTTDKDKIDDYWRANPEAKPCINTFRENADGSYVEEAYFINITVQNGTYSRYPFDDTLHFTKDDKTVYLYAYTEEIWSGDCAAADVTEGIHLSIDCYELLPPNTTGPFVFAPLPKWIVDHYWGEEFRGLPLDTPEAVSAARDLLRRAKPPKDMVLHDYRQVPRPTKWEVREAERILNDSEALDLCHKSARQVMENAEAERDTKQVFDICKQVFDLGISEGRARVLIDLFWNECGKPAYIPAEVDKEIMVVWRPDWGLASLDDIPRRLRWRFRDEDADWLMAENEIEDLLLGEFLSIKSRLMMYAPTGIGKTTFALALAVHVAAGKDFLHWKGSGKLRRVLYVDGEMSKALMRARFQDAIRRLGERPSGLAVLNREQTPELPSLDTAEGQRWLNRYIEDHGPFDLIVFDNIASLLAGSMIGPESWKATLPWVQNMTARGIAQIWVHHTGIDKSHAYGDSTREFAMDTVAKLDPIYHAETDVCFKLSFPKARRRAPDNRSDFETVQIQLLANEWQTSGGKKPGIERVELFEAALAASGAISDETAISHADLARLLADEATDVQTWRKRITAAAQTKPYHHLLVAKDGVKFWRAAI